MCMYLRPLAYVHERINMCGFWLYHAVSRHALHQRPYSWTYVGGVLDMGPKKEPFIKGLLSYPRHLNQN